jgi:hypothetical protein
MSESGEKERELSESELAFLLALVWELSHLNMNGPAHQLAREKGFSSMQLERLRRASGNRFTVEMHSGERIAHQGWPWGELTSAEILEILDRG